MAFLAQGFIRDYPDRGSGSVIPRCGRTGAQDAAHSLAAGSAKADFAFSQRRIHSLQRRHIAGSDSQRASSPGEVLASDILIRPVTEEEMEWHRTHPHDAYRKQRDR